MADVDHQAQHQLQDGDVLRLAVGAQLPGLARPLDEPFTERVELGAQLGDPLMPARGAEDELSLSAVCGLQLERPLETLAIPSFEL